VKIIVAMPAKEAQFCDCCRNMGISFVV